MIEWNFENTFYVAAIITSIMVILGYVLLKDKVRKKK